MTNIRIGLGHDIHALVPDRPLWLGGIKIPYKLGLKGHSDADALIHAIMDAMLGALALDDIGTHFPDTDPKYKNISSVKLLQKVYELIKEKGYKINNLDCIIHCEKPKLSPYKAEMEKTIAKILEVDTNQISIKAGTNEGFDAVGEIKAIECQAIVLLVKI